MRGVFSWAAFDHATRDRSRFERPGPRVTKWARMEKVLYDIAGRRGLVALDIGLAALCAYFTVSSLKRGLAPEKPKMQVSSDILAKVRASVEQEMCACCNAPVRGTLKDIPDDAVSLKGAVGYPCSSCGALICEDCAENQIGRSVWDGWARRRCPVCGGKFAPDTVIVAS